MPASTVSTSKLAANRANARKSTGPRTARGKAIAARNNLKHGLFARDLLQPGESAAELTQLKVNFIRRLNPRDPVELDLVERIIAASWKLRRLQRFEATLVQQACQEWEDEPSNDREAFGLGKHDPVPVEVAWQNSSPEFKAQLERIAVQERQLESSMRRNFRQLDTLQKADVSDPITEFAAEAVAAEQNADQKREVEATTVEQLEHAAALDAARQHRKERQEGIELDAIIAENSKVEAKRQARADARQRRREQQAERRREIGPCFSIPMLKGG